MYRNGFWSWAAVLLQKFLHPFHPLLILYLGKGIFHSVDGVEIGEVQLSKVIGIRFLGPVEDMTRDPLHLWYRDRAAEQPAAYVFPPCLPPLPQWALHAATV